MSEAFGSDYLTIEDDDGNEFELEVLDEFELDGQSYLAALPADMDEDDPDSRNIPTAYQFPYTKISLPTAATAVRRCSIIKTMPRVKSLRE